MEASVKAFNRDADPDSRVAMVQELVKDIQTRSAAGGGSPEGIIADWIAVSVGVCVSSGKSFDNACELVEDFLLAHRAILTGSVPQGRRVGFVQ